MEPPSRPGPPDHFDPDSTDTLPLLREEDVDAQLPPPGVEPVRVRPRVRVGDAVPPEHVLTDTFQAPTLAPIAARPVDTSDLAATLREHELQLQQAVERIAALQAQLEAADRRCHELERECTTLREAAARSADVGPPPAGEAAAPPPVQPGPASLPADDAPLQQLRRQNERLHEALCCVQARIGVHEAMLAEAEEALAAARAGGTPAAPQAAPAAPAAPAPRTDWQARFIELETVLESERAVAAERAREHEQQLALLQAELAAARGQPGGTGGAAALRTLPIGSRLRVLVREEQGTEVVYPLGRHTTIGRTPDNDIQVNTSFVSRHHAVLLTSSEHCIIEDLNSTNGINVNGRRVDRQLLNDGDVVTIGKTHFRYETRE